MVFNSLYFNNNISGMVNRIGVMCKGQFIILVWNRIGAVAQSGRASALQAGGCGFDSHLLHH